MISASQGDPPAFIGCHNVFVTAMVGQVKTNWFKQRIRHPRVEIHTERRKPFDKILTANHAYLTSSPESG